MFPMTSSQSPLQSPYDLFSPPITDLEDIQLEPTDKITLSEESVGDCFYYGEFLNGDKHGLGMLYYKKLFHYVGGFSNNKINGFGVARLPGRMYSGQWVENERSGQGVETCNDGRKYDGSWIEDKKNGYGTYTFENGNVWKGNFYADKQHGLGTVVFKTGLVKKGIWENGRRVKWLEES